MVDSARKLAPGLVEDVDSLLSEYEDKVGIDELNEQLGQFKQQAVDKPVLLGTTKYIDDASVYLNEAIMSLAIDLALDDLSSFTDQSLQDVGTFLEELQADVLGD
mgnify:CR=1 FL=1